MPTLALWPSHIKAGSIITEPTSTLDYLPTIAQLVDYQIPDNRPIDGSSLLPLFEQKPFKRAQPIPFRTKKVFGLIDGKYKLIRRNKPKPMLQLFDLENDPQEQHDISAANLERVSAMYQTFLRFNKSAKNSQQGGDYADDDFVPVGKWQRLK